MYHLHQHLGVDEVVATTYDADCATLTGGPSDGLDRHRVSAGEELDGEVRGAGRVIVYG